MTKPKLKKSHEARPLEDHIEAIVEKVIEEREINLAVEDVQIIVKEMMPDIDKMISKKVKTHLYSVGLFLMETCRTEE
jgi:predicted component of type VI protein secretion system